MICHQPHDIFFHRDCVAGNVQRNLSGGVVELAWYLPGGKKEDHFDNMMAIANLRDDAKKHTKQFELLNKRYEIYQRKVRHKQKTKEI